MTQNKTSNPYMKTIKRKSFDILDSSFGCLVFILFQVLFFAFYTKLPVSFLSNGIVLIIAQVIIEALFFLNVLFTSKMQNVEWIQATNIKRKLDLKSALFAVIIACITMFCFAPLSNIFVYGVQSIGFKYYSSYIDVSNVIILDTLQRL